MLTVKKTFSKAFSKANIVSVSIFSLIIFIDQFTKIWVTKIWVTKILGSNFLAPNLSNTIVFNKFLSFELAFNKGISWGIGQATSTWQYLILINLIGFFIAGFIYHTRTRIKQNLSILPEIFILAGAVSNLIDRFRIGAVIDFIALSWGSWHWPVFNIADIAIVLGVIVLFAREFFGKS